MTSPNVYHAMLGRHVAIVGPVRHDVSDIDDEGAWYRSRRDPATRSVPDVQPAGIILGQERDRTVIRMRGRAELIFRRSLRLRRVVQQPEKRRRLVKARLEEIFLERERYGEAREQGSPDLFHRHHVGEHRVTKVGELGPLIRPLQRSHSEQVGMIGRELVHDHERLAQVRRELFVEPVTGGANIAAVKGVDGERVPFHQRLGMKAHRLREDVPEKLLRNTMICEIEKADLLASNIQSAGDVLRVAGHVEDWQPVFWHLDSQTCHDRNLSIARGTLPAMLRGILFAVLATSFSAVAIGQSHKIIFDTDFILPPGDDGLALLLALQSPELEILAITTVAGNASVERATAEVLWLLESVGRMEIPVYQGADMPWVHERSDFAVDHYGKWYSNDAPPPPPGGHAQKKVEKETAVELLVRSVLASPGEITIVAIGPMTNVATAIRQNAAFAESVRELVIMGGAVASLEDGAGNITPNAEFNFWVDPEAARVALRSGIPIMLSPLNVSRKTALTKKWYEKMVASDTVITRLLKTTMGPRFDRDPDRVWLMYDQVAVGSLIDPTLVVTEELFVDVDDNRGVSYGTSVGGTEIWPGAEGAQKMKVQHDLDWLRFIEMFVERMNAPDSR